MMNLKIIALLLLFGVPPGQAHPVPVMIWPGFAHLPIADDVAAAHAGQPGNPAHDLTATTTTSTQHQRSVDTDQGSERERADKAYRGEELASPFDDAGTANAGGNRLASSLGEDADEAAGKGNQDRGQPNPHRRRYPTQTGNNPNRNRHSSNSPPGSLLSGSRTRGGNGNSTRSSSPEISVHKRNDESGESGEPVPENSGGDSHLAAGSGDKGIAGPGTVVNGGEGDEGGGGGEGGTEDREPAGERGDAASGVSGVEAPSEGQQAERGERGGSSSREAAAGAEAPVAGVMRGATGGTGGVRGIGGQGTAASASASAPAGRERSGGSDGDEAVTAGPQAASEDRRVSAQPALENGEAVTGRIPNLSSRDAPRVTTPGTHQQQPFITAAAAAAGAANIPPVVHHHDAGASSSNNGDNADNPRISQDSETTAPPTSQCPATLLADATAGLTDHPDTAEPNAAAAEAGNSPQPDTTDSILVQSGAGAGARSGAASGEDPEGSENKSREIPEGGTGGIGQPLVLDANTGPSPSTTTTTAAVTATRTMSWTTLPPPSTSTPPSPSNSPQPESEARRDEESPPSTARIRVTRSEPRIHPSTRSTPPTIQSTASLHHQSPFATRFVPPPVLTEGGSTSPLTTATTPPRTAPQSTARPAAAEGEMSTGTVVAGNGGSGSGGGGGGEGDFPVEASAGSVPNEENQPPSASSIPPVVDPAAVPTTEPREVIHPVFPVDNTTILSSTSSVTPPPPLPTSDTAVTLNATTTATTVATQQRGDSTPEVSSNAALSPEETASVNPVLGTFHETSPVAREHGTGPAESVSAASNSSSDPVSRPEVRTLPTDAQGIVIVDNDGLASRSTSVPAGRDVPLPTVNSSLATSGTSSVHGADDSAASMSTSSSVAPEPTVPNGVAVDEETSEKPEADKDRSHVTNAGVSPSFGSGSESTLTTTAAPLTASTPLEQPEGGAPSSAQTYHSNASSPSGDYASSPPLTTNIPTTASSTLSSTDSAEYVLPPEFSGSGSGSGAGVDADGSSTTHATAPFTSIGDRTVAVPTTSASNGEAATANQGESGGQDQAKKEPSETPPVSTVSWTSALSRASASSPVADRTTTSEWSYTSDDSSSRVTDNDGSNRTANNTDTDTSNSSGSRGNNNTDSDENNNTNDSNNNNNDRGSPAPSTTTSSSSAASATTTSTARTSTETTGTTSPRKEVVIVPGATPGPVYIELKFGMTWSEFCNNEVTFYLELVDIVRQDGQQESFTADQIRLLANARKTCALMTVRGRQNGLMEEAEIYVQLYLVNKSHHYDVLLTNVCARVIQQGFEVRERSVFQDKLLKVQLHELLEQEGEESVPDDNQEDDDVSDDDDFLDAPGVTIVIVIAVIGGVCCAVLIIMQIVVRRRIREGVRTYNRSYSVTSVDSIALNNVTKSRPNSGIFNPALDLFSERLPGQVSHAMTYPQLANFVTDLESIYEEFQCIPNKTPRLSVVPNGAEDKNRFANILPIPQTRVRLERDGQNEIAGYINANYVSGYNSQAKAYIATQALLDGTVCDFWTMVWQQGSKAIVMLINPHEDGHKKCATYFPDSVGPECALLNGDYSVIMTKRDVHQEYITSWLTVKQIKTGEIREVRHFWLTCWPISGRPDPISLVRFVLDSRPQYEDTGAPLVVHCSNGTARTGTFLALDICMRQYEDRRTVDVMGCVYGLRQERAGCVQTSEQYAILYQALYEYATILSSPVVSAASSATTLHNTLS